jgi:hypothetical protein
VAPPARSWTAIVYAVTHRHNPRSSFFPTIRRNKMFFAICIKLSCAAFRGKEFKLSAAMYIAWCKQDPLHRRAVVLVSNINAIITNLLLLSSYLLLHAAVTFKILFGTFHRVITKYICAKQIQLETRIEHDYFYYYLSSFVTRKLIQNRKCAHDAWWEGVLTWPTKDPNHMSTAHCWKRHFKRNLKLGKINGAVVLLGGWLQAWQDEIVQLSRRTSSEGIWRESRCQGRFAHFTTIAFKLTDVTCCMTSLVA